MMKLPDLRAIGLCLAWLLALALPVDGAQAQIARTEHVTAELIAEGQALTPGQIATIGVHFTMAPGWHIYWRNPGEAGLPTKVSWKLPNGLRAGELAWPHPQRLPFQGIINYGYEGQVTLLTQIQVPASARAGEVVRLAADLDWLVCAQVCIPESGQVSLALRVADGPLLANPATAQRFRQARRDMPRAPSGWRFAAERAEGGYLLFAVPASGQAATQDAAYFFSDLAGVIDSSAAQPVTLGDGVLMASLPRSPSGKQPPDRLQGVWLSPIGWGASGVTAAAIDVPVSPAGKIGGQYATRLSSGGEALPGMLALALLGGLVLNLMPCVFPVLGLKVLGFAKAANEDRRGTIVHALAFGAGVLVSFWALAGILAGLRAGGERFGWGFQLQSPSFVYLLAAIMLALALNLSGVFPIGRRLSGVGGSWQRQSGLLGSFLTGLLVTVLATPCSAPFLGPALGSALILPPFQSFMVFTAIAIGLASPYLVLALFPGLLRRIPRAGRWMETLKQALAFPLYATAAYLLWVLSGQVEDDAGLAAALGLVLFAAGLWAYGRLAQNGTRPWRSLAVLALFAVSAAFVGWPRPAATTAQSAETLAWEPWSPERVAELQAQDRTIYVDFTARWCATCLVNKRVVFGHAGVQRALRDQRVALLKADWTNRDPRITAALAQYGRSAIPFALVYKPGRPEPLPLPELLRPSVVEAALR